MSESPHGELLGQRGPSSEDFAVQRGHAATVVGVVVESVELEGYVSIARPLQPIVLYRAAHAPARRQSPRANTQVS